MRYGHAQGDWRIVLIRNTTRAISRKQRKAQAVKGHWQLWRDLRVEVEENRVFSYGQSNSLKLFCLQIILKPRYPHYKMSCQKTFLGRGNKTPKEIDYF